MVKEEVRVMEEVGVVMEEMSGDGGGGSGDGGGRGESEVLRLTKVCMGENFSGKTFSNKI